MKTLNSCLIRIFSTDPFNPISRLINVLLVSLIFGSLLALVLESYDDLAFTYYNWFRTFDLTIGIIFSLEYVGRLIIAPNFHKHMSRTQARWRQIKSVEGIIDILSLLPFYLPFFFPFSLAFLRALRLLRIFRILKLKRYAWVVSLFTRVMAREKEGLLLSLFMAILLIFVSSSLVYTFEYPVQPEVFSDIPTTMWWALITMTTIGYGDMVPMTLGGRLATAGLALLGVLVIAVPTALMTSGFLNDIKKNEEKKGE